MGLICATSSDCGSRLDDARTAHSNAQPVRVAVLVTDITNYRSIQLKGVVFAGAHDGQR
jgi:hypothetical protein